MVIDKENVVLGVVGGKAPYCKCGNQVCGSEDLPNNSPLKVLTTFMCVDCIISKISLDVVCEGIDNFQLDAVSQEKGPKQYEWTDYQESLDKAVTILARTNMHKRLWNRVGAHVILRKYHMENKKPPNPETLAKVLLKA